MLPLFVQNTTYFVRLILAMICGGMIGYERTNRGKGAGIRTHSIVSIASCLMMIVSKYGFFDMQVIGDGSRIAAQVVSGIGFLGAGMIYFNGRHSVKGLTTAAGIWATSGIGLAIGAGMYTIGILTSLVIVIMQIVLHKNFKLLQTPNEESMSLIVPDNKESVEYINNTLKNYNITVVSLKKCTRTQDNMLELQLKVHVPQDLDYGKLLEVFQESKSISSITI